MGEERRARSLEGNLIVAQLLNSAATQVLGTTKNKKWEIDVHANFHTVTFALDRGLPLQR